MPKKTSKKVKKLKTTILKLPSSNLVDLSLEGVVADLQAMIGSSGWKRLKELVEENIANLTEKLDKHEYDSLVDFNRDRDKRNIYRSLLSLPERHISLIIDKPGTHNEDPYE